MGGLEASGFWHCLFSRTDIKIIASTIATPGIGNKSPQYRQIYISEPLFTAPPSILLTSELAWNFVYWAGVYRGIALSKRPAC